ncbi:lactate racemase domain-containing protein [Streptomyces sp. NPDC021224]|uniref:lactate racemase domain-containing protein n=1 Tax=unclassified Streptomyces TaxID=2593676 RepID=UPI0037B6C5D6
MRTRLAYGESGPDIDVDPAVTALAEPVHHEAVPDQAAALVAALRRPVAGPPLRELIRPGQTVAISMCDGTRPQPRHLMLPAVLAELNGSCASPTW